MKKFIAVFMISALTIGSVISANAGEINDKIKLSSIASTQSTYFNVIWGGDLDGNYNLVADFVSRKGVGIKNLDNPQIDYEVRSVDSNNRETVIMSSRYLGINTYDGIGGGLEGRHLKVYVKTSTGQNIYTKVQVTDNIDYFD